jgi:hypothetical protein
MEAKEEGSEASIEATTTGGAGPGVQSSLEAGRASIDPRLLTSRILLAAALERAMVATLAEGTGLIKIALAEGELPADARAILAKHRSGDTISFDEYDAAVAQLETAKAEFDRATTSDLLALRTPDRAPRPSMPLGGRGGAAQTALFDTQFTPLADEREERTKEYPAALVAQAVAGTQKRGSGGDSKTQEIAGALRDIPRSRRSLSISCAARLKRIRRRSARNILPPRRWRRFVRSSRAHSASAWRPQLAARGPLMMDHLLDLGINAASVTMNEMTKQ